MESLFSKALDFANKHHAGQKRKNSGLPYIVHPISVASIVAKYKPESTNLELLMTCAILHDLLEDTHITLQEIFTLFGPKVASIVEELTSDPDQIKAIGKTEYLKQKMTKMSTYALVIKLCDRLDNLSDLPITLANNKILDKYQETISIIAHIEKNRKLTPTHKKLINQILLLMSSK